MPFNSHELGVYIRVDDVAGNGPGMCCSPSHRMSFDSIYKGSKCGLMKWREIFARPYIRDTALLPESAIHQTIQLQPISGRALPAVCRCFLLIRGGLVWSVMLWTRLVSSICLRF